MFTVFAWQLAFMASAHLVVDYAAYVAARSASVVIPQDATADGDPANSPVETKDPDTTESGWGDGVNMETQDPDGEAPNAIDARDSVPAGGLLSRVQDATPEALQGVSPLDISYSGKVSVVHGAAVMACYPISGLLSLNNMDPSSLAAFQGVTKVPGGEWIMDKLGGLIGSGNQAGNQGPGRPVFLDFANRYMYAYMNTKVRIQPQENAGDQPRSFGGGEPLTAEVIHDFQLAIPFARTILGDDGNTHPNLWERVRMLGVGRYTTITARATMLSEGYAETRPADASADKYPKQLPGGG